jgi:ferredoxin
MGSAAEVMLDHGQARPITRERMFELLDEADREGLVLQPQNTRNPLFICLCCGCCCVALRAGKQHPRPADFFSSSYQAVLDAALCDACQACLDRCQMEALSMPDAAACVDLARCIGCGLCVSVCPSGALRLDPKSDPASPPADTSALYRRIYMERFGAVGLAQTAARQLARRWL